MEENFKSKVGFCLFIFIILFLGIGGYFFTKKIISNDNSINTDNNEIISYKIDNNKDYIYYKNEEVISESAEIYYKDVVINLNTQEVLSETLNKENNIYKENIKYISDINILSNDLINYNNDNLYALNFREYETYEFDKYVSLVINDYNYTCFDLITFDKVKSYVFDTSNGKLLSNEELLSMYNLSLDNIKDNIRNVLNNEQSINEDKELIKIEDTINDLKYGLYINDYGKLYISYIVKTNEVDYNKVMEVN